MHMRRYAFRSYYLWPKDDVAGKIIPIDVWTAINWKGVDYISGDEVLKGIVDFNGISVASSPVRAAITLLKRIVQYGNIREKYKDDIVAQAEAGNLDEMMNIALGTALGKELIASIVSLNWQNVDKLAPSLKKTILKRGFTRAPLKQTLRTLQYMWGWLQQFSLQSGMLLCFIGPDGSGKTSLSAALSQRNKIFASVIYRHGRFAILPELKTLIGRDAENNDKNDLHFQLSKELNLQASMPKTEFGLLRSLVYMMYYGLDYLLGYLYAFIQRGVGKIIIFDRYYYDYMILREYQRVPPFVFGLMFKIIPRPEMIIFPKDDPNAIFTRKPELSKDEIRRQIGICTAISKMLPVHILDGCDGLEASINQMIGDIYLYQSAKYNYNLD